jgi:plasmid maintenance system antidote protein VapI
MLLFGEEDVMAQTIEIPQPRLQLRHAILESGMPAWKVGHLAGVSATVLSHICTGRRDVQQDEASRIADVLGADASELFPELTAEAA